LPILIKALQKIEKMEVNENDNDEISENV